MYNFTCFNRSCSLIACSLIFLKLGLGGDGNGLVRRFCFILVIRAYGIDLGHAVLALVIRHRDVLEICPRSLGALQKSAPLIDTLTEGQGS